MLPARLIAKTSPLIANVSKRAIYSAVPRLKEQALTNIGAYATYHSIPTLHDSVRSVLSSWIGTILETITENWPKASTPSPDGTNPYTIAGIAVVCLAAGYYAGWHARDEIITALREQASHSENRSSLQM
ncbi:MAG: hypothetical protein JSS53_01285 [Proteobacteria bacterium]|nr:hypothetical protein [Pseudomonadota bacterium]